MRLLLTVLVAHSTLYTSTQINSLVIFIRLTTILVHQTAILEGNQRGHFNGIYIISVIDDLITQVTEFHRQIIIFHHLHVITFSLNEARDHLWGLRYHQNYHLHYFVLFCFVFVCIVFIFCFERERE